MWIEREPEGQGAHILAHCARQLQQVIAAQYESSLSRFANETVEQDRCSRGPLSPLYALPEQLLDPRLKRILHRVHGVNVYELDEIRDAGESRCHQDEVIRRTK